MELEYKYFAAVPEAFEKLLEDATLGTFALRRTVVQRVEDTYADTERMDLMRQGFYLRLRLLDGDCIATIKSLNQPTQDLHVREEIENVVPDQMDISSWPDSPVRAKIRSLLGRGPLLRLFLLSQKRTRRIITGAHGIENPLAVMSLDNIVLKTRGTAHSWREVEIELSSADRIAELDKMDEEMRERGFLPETRSKFEQALEIVGWSPIKEFRNN